jgi:hypothetical protein
MALEKSKEPLKEWRSGLENKLPRVFLEGLMNLL